MFKQLACLPPTTTPEEEALYTRPLPFRTFEYPGEEHPGLRAYPFLAQARRCSTMVGRGCSAAGFLWAGYLSDAGLPYFCGLADC